MKNRRRTTTKAKRSSAPKARGRRNPSSTNANTKNALLTRERDELLEQQKATAEVLRVISASPGDLKLVFEILLQKAVKICDGKFGTLVLSEGDYNFRVVATHNAPPAFADLRLREPVIRRGPGTAMGQVFETKQVVQITDIAADNSVAPTHAQIASARTLVIVPMLKDEELLGGIGIYRQEVRPFSRKQIDLLQNFAAQAVIAIENTRLLNELRQSLEQQTATAEVLSVISSSPGNLEPVFEAMLEKAARVCDANFGVLELCEDGGFRMAALHNPPPAYSEARRRAPVMHPGPLSPPARVAATKQLLHVADLTEEAAYKEGDPAVVRFVEIAGVRTFLVVPMLKEKELIGEISVYRQEVHPFTDKQVALVQNFAAQAVIAIENTRLLNELRQRTDDLSESLEQQTATSEVLSVISSTPGELEPVFQTMLANAVRICDAKFGVLYRYDNEALDTVAMFGTTPKHADHLRRRGRFQPIAGTTLDLLLRTREVVRVADGSASITDGSAEQVAGTAAKFGGARSLINVPMLKEHVLIGAITIYRQEVRPFTDKQIALVQNFAAQAVIAIENTRLLNELRQSLEQQTATADVLRVISSSPGELEPVFQAMLESATRICEAKIGNLLLFDGRDMRVVAMHNAPREHEEMRRRNPVIPLERSIAGPLVRTKKLVFVADITAEEPYASSPLAKVGGARTAMAVPMLREDELVGAITIYREEVRPFTDKQIALLQSFAAQAVIAIENTRLLNELRESLEQQTATSEVLRVISSSPGDSGPVFETMLENAVRLCAAQFGMLFLYDEREREFRAAATWNLPTAYAENLGKNSIRYNSRIPMGRAAISKQPVHVADVRSDPAYIDGLPGMVGVADLGGARTLVQVPMLKDNNLVGTIGIYRQEVHPFTEKQIALVQNFAAQAVIAIENTRLLNELRQRTTDLTESLEQQTATSEVLQVVSSSQTSVQPVLDAVVASAAHLCQALNATIHLRDGDFVVPSAHSGPLRVKSCRRALTAQSPMGHRSRDTQRMHYPCPRPAK